MQYKSNVSTRNFIIKQHVRKKERITKQKKKRNRQEIGMTELFKCNLCGRMFKTEHGVKVHKGRKHKKKTAKQEKRRVQVLEAAKKYKKSEKGKKTAAKYERSAKGKKRRKKYRNSTQGVQSALRNEETRRQKRWDEIEEREEAKREARNKEIFDAIIRVFE